MGANALLVEQTHLGDETFSLATIIPTLTPGLTITVRTRTGRFPP
jgi:hypothetical protein